VPPCLLTTVLDAFHGIDVGISGLVASSQRKLTGLESSYFILITIKNYVLSRKIFVHDHFCYTVNMSFGTRTYFGLRFVMSEISVKFSA